MRNTLQIEYRKLAELSGLDQTLRVHNPAQQRKIAAFTRAYGPLRPILIDPAGRVVDGVALAQTLQEQGYEEVPVVVVHGRSPDELRLIRLGLNRLAEDAAWNKAALASEFRELLALSFDVELAGFDAVEIDMALAIEDETGSAEVEDAPPDPRAGPTVAQPGDLWLLGEHRLVCGDARDPAALARLMGEDRARMVFTDPPYNVAIDGFVAGRGRHREFAMASGEMSEGEFVAFLTQALSAMTPHLVDGAILDVCMDWRHTAEVLAAIQAAGLTLMNLCVWAKTNAGMGTFYRSQHELVWIAKHGSAPHTNTFELGQKGRSRSNLWTYRGMNAVGGERDELIKLHPTVKPAALVADAIKDVSSRGEIVLDPFLGSGTTLIAAERTGRRGYGLEFDPAYADVILRRYQAETGRMPILADTGERFDAREEALRAMEPAHDQA
jgi:DNA modification methylase